MNWNFTTQTTLKTTLLLALLALATACSQPATSTEGSTDSASRVIVTTPSSTTSVPVLYCNEKTQGGMTAKLKVYTDSTNKIRMDLMKVKFTAMPSSLSSGDQIQFYRWQASPNGSIYMDPTPVSARFETMNGTVLTNFSQVTYWSQIAGYAANAGITDLNVFLKNVQIVVDIKDAQGSYDALKIALYDSAGTNKINMDVLMPAFAASPADYANDGGQTRHSLLQTLHPFASLKTQSYTSLQFQTLGNSFCF